jgi:hypothetical protein
MAHQEVNFKVAAQEANFQVAVKVKEDKVVQAGQTGKMAAVTRIAIILAARLQPNSLEKLRHGWHAFKLINRKNPPAVRVGFYFLLLFTLERNLITPKRK